ncbi:hypothetical protein MUN74_18635 [Agromyces endophyticus]|uniref:hypothetical protein n=1 Tax=Agromyces sp. H17E-10 TaxID=2932244 RepID=UPI001FD5FD56|nr:hypothetical protein [Agromyces sp. H17E-10]UOQ89247.1 hypothetical protein MUN74_18635 [Agromyces sp. H17E-10]
MTPAAPLSSSTARLERVDELQARIHGMQATRLDTRAVPTHPAFAGLLPGGSLREGTVVEARGSTTLVMALLATPSASGRWVAVVGMPEFGVEAAARFGIDLDRLVLVPEPGRQWLPVVAALADVIPVVAVRPTERVAPAEASRLAARLRERGAVLIAAGAWPGSDASLEVEASEWHGLGVGHGLLDEREVVVSAAGRGSFVKRRRSRLRLPDRSLGFAAMAEAGAARPAGVLSSSEAAPSAGGPGLAPVLHGEFRRPA